MRLTRVTLFFVVLIIGLGFYRLADYLLEDTETQTFQATEEMMVDTAHILAALIESESEDLYAIEHLFEAAKKRKFEAQIFKHLKTSVGVAAYVTDQDGVVIYDSGNQENAGEDFSKKRDVALTLQGKYGVRTSRADPENPFAYIMHVAAPVYHRGEIVGCVTVYKSQADVRSFIDKREKDIVSAIIFIGVGIVILITAVFIWLFRPVGRLTEFSRAISRGERKPRPDVGLGREVNTLANALHDMREALEGRKYADQYIQTLTHELKSPLAAIQGAAELIDDNMPTKDRQHFLDNIRDQTARCERMIRRLLELSAVEAQSHLEDLPSIDLMATARHAIADMNPLADASEVSLTPDLSGTVHVIANERLLRSAISQLLENAIQFSPSGGEVKLNITSTEQIITLTVTDEGPGIPKFAAERAFERFYSYRQEAPTKGKGNGLGLSFVREVAELHHGTAAIAGLPEKGTIATITLPREIREQS